VWRDEWHAPLEGRANKEVTMKTSDAELPRRRNWGAKAAGALAAIGMALAFAGPAAADDRWDGHNHWKKHGHYYHPGHYPYGQYKKHKHKHWDHGPRVVHVQPQPVYVAPPPVYYQPAPVYYGRPNISIVFPIDLD
jgi:hypothetical protein